MDDHPPGFHPTRLPDRTESAGEVVSRAYLSLLSNGLGLGAPPPRIHDPWTSLDGRSKLAIAGDGGGVALAQG